MLKNVINITSIYTQDGWHWKKNNVGDQVTKNKQFHKTNYFIEEEKSDRKSVDNDDEEVGGDIYRVSSF